MLCIWWDGGVAFLFLLINTVFVVEAKATRSSKEKRVPNFREMAPLLASAIKVGHVHDVQQLREENPNKLPQRFIRDDVERPKLLTHHFQNLPIIDLSRLMKGEQDEIFKLRAACEDWGFFQVLNHGIDVEVIDSMEKVAKDFFMLPLEEKKKYPMLPGTIQGYGQAFVFSKEQKLDWCNMLSLGVEPPSIRRPPLWPTKPSAFSETLEIYSREVRNLCKNLLECIAMSLGLKGGVFQEMFGVAVQAVRINYYPPCPRPDLVLGLSPHSDGSALTVLQQGKGSSIGLQILKGDKWVPVQPIDGALVINVGDTIEVLSNGKYKSVEHRAIANKERDRLSIVTFYAPSYEVEVGPMQEFVDENNPCKYRRYNHGEYSKNYVSNKLQGKRSLEFAKIQINNFAQ